VPEVKIIAVNMGDAVTEVQSFIDRYDLTMTVLRDTQKSFKEQFNIRSYPMTIMVNKYGVITDIVVGEMTEFSQIIEKMRHTAIS